MVNVYGAIVLNGYGRQIVDGEAQVAHEAKLDADGYEASALWFLPIFRRWTVPIYKAALSKLSAKRMDLLPCPMV